MSTCPECGRAGVPAIFGLPIEAARSAADAGELVLLGCFEPLEPVHYRCAAGHGWAAEDVARWDSDVLAVLVRHGHEDLSTEA